MRDSVTLTIESIRTKTKNPIIEIGANGESETFELDEKEKSFQITLTERKNIISVKLINKDPSDTKVKDNQIVEDLAVMIKSIKYRTYDFYNFIEYISRYTKDDGDIVKGVHGFMGFNGTYEIFLEVPLFVFAKNITIKNHHNQLDNLYESHKN